MTDIAGYKNSQRSDDVIRNWIRNRNTIEFLGLWEEIYNKNFKPVEFDGIKKSILIREGMSQGERLVKLNNVAIYQMKILIKDLGVGYGNELIGVERS